MYFRLSHATIEIFSLICISRSFKKGASNNTISYLDLLVLSPLTYSETSWPDSILIGRNTSKLDESIISALKFLKKGPISPPATYIVVWTHDIFVYFSHMNIFFHDVNKKQIWEALRKSSFFLQALLFLKNIISHGSAKIK